MSWDRLAQAWLAALLVAGLQAIPYLWQPHQPDKIIGRADLRLAVPFGWALGWFGAGFAIDGESDLRCVAPGVGAR